MRELIEAAIVKKARAELRKQQRSEATRKKYAAKFHTRTGNKAGTPTLKDPAVWSLHPHFDPRYCIKHARYLARVIWGKLQAGTYETVPAVRFSIEKPGGGARIINCFTVVDSAIANLVHSMATKRNGNLFSSSSYAYRPDKTIFDAIINLRRSINGHKIYVVQYDFRRYFDSIDHLYLEKIIKDAEHFILSSSERAAIRAFMSYRFASFEDYGSGIYETSTIGVPQGSSLSLFLANATSHALDLKLEKMNGSFVRFADDVVAVTNSYSDALSIAHAFTSHCDSAGLSINRDKSPGICLLGNSVELDQRTHVVDGDDVSAIKTISSFEYLGHNIGHNIVQLPDKSIKRIKRRVSEIIYKHLLMYIRDKTDPPYTGSISKNRVGPGYYDWDLVTCLNELRKYIYGGLGESQIRAFLDHNTKPAGVRGLMAFLPLMTDRKQLEELDGWLLNVLTRAQRERVKVLKSKGIKLRPLSRKRIISGKWYKYPDIPQDSAAPSFVRSWRFSRKYYTKYGLKGITPPAYYSITSY